LTRGTLWPIGALLLSRCDEPGSGRAPCSANSPPSRLINIAPFTAGEHAIRADTVPTDAAALVRDQVTHLVRLAERWRMPGSTTQPVFGRQRQEAVLER
jgi:hypothetical protein